jgi:hypothetical protein
MCVVMLMVSNATFSVAVSFIGGRNRNIR